MSRIGKSPITVAKEIVVEIVKNVVTVKGPKGTLSFTIPEGVTAAFADGVITVSITGNDAKVDALHGLVRAEIDNMIHGVSTGWTKTLVLSGVGFRAVVTGVNLVLTVGFSHPVTVTPPPGITFSVVEGKILVSGIDKQLVGQIASDIRKVKPPEPYKGKGILYEGEHIRKKAGKSAKGAGAPPAK